MVADSYMPDNDISRPTPKSRQDYFLLGACITNALLLLPLIWTLAYHLYKPAVSPDFLPSITCFVKPEIDIPLYIISWIAVLIPFLAYYFINRWLSRRLDTGTKHVLSKGLFFFSLITLCGVQGLFLARVLFGSTKSLNLPVVILAFCYLAIATFIIGSCLFQVFRNPKSLSRFINWSILIFMIVMGGAGALLVRFVYTNFSIANAVEHLHTYLPSETMIRNTSFSWVEMLLTALFILLFLGLLIFFETKLRLKNGLLVLVVDLCVAFAIAYAVFGIVTYPISFAFDRDFYMGPINDVIHGKTLLVDSMSQYGILSIYSLALLFKIPGIHLTYGNFELLVTISFIAGYILIYLLLRRWLRNLLIPIFGIFFIVLQHYFVNLYNPILSPQCFFLRFGWWIPVMFLLLIRTRLATGGRNHLRWILRSVELLFVAIAFFWILDAGIFVLGAYIVAIFVEEFYVRSGGNLKIRDLLFRMAQIIAMLIAMLIVLFVAISILTFVRSHQWPYWYKYIQYSLTFGAGGLSLVRMPVTGLWVVFVAVYLLSAIYIMVKLFFGGGKTERDLPIISFITAYGILQFGYYVGESRAATLHTLVIAPIMIICWFMLKGLHFALSGDGRAFLNRNVLKVSSISLFVILLLSPPILLSTKQMVSQVVSRGNVIALISSREDGSRLSPDTNTQSMALDSVKAIDEIEKGRERVAIVSSEDTWFLVQTKRTNVMNSNNLKQFDLLSQLDELAPQLLNARPSSVYIDHTVSSWSVGYIKDKIQDDYYFDETVGLLDRYVPRTTPHLTLYSIGDTTIVAQDPNRNYGTGTAVIIQSSVSSGTQSAQRGLFQFDLSSIPAGSTITSATFSAYYYYYYAAGLDPTGRTYYLYRNTGNWTETGVTWNTQPGYTTSQGASATMPGSFGWVSWNVKDIVQSWVNGAPNYGLVMMDGNETQGVIKLAEFLSREYANPFDFSSPAPKLMIDYSPPGSTPTPK